MKHDFFTLLATRLRHPLPGWSAQAPFQPELGFGRHRGPAPENVKRAAVLALLFPRDGRWRLPLILRPDHMLDHAGQVSLPGGVIEPGESSQQAALREFSEELGAPADGLQLLGQLSRLYLFASNFEIVPWLAVSPSVLTWQPNPGEVERVLEVPLEHLLDPCNVASFERRQRSLSFRAPCFLWQAEHIWGATSMILAELVSLLGECSAESMVPAPPRVES